MSAEDTQHKIELVCTLLHHNVSCKNVLFQKIASDCALASASDCALDCALDRALDCALVKNRATHIRTLRFALRFAESCDRFFKENDVEMEWDSIAYSVWARWEYCAAELLRCRLECSDMSRFLRIAHACGDTIPASQVDIPGTLAFFKQYPDWKIMLITMYEHHMKRNISFTYLNESVKSREQCRIFFNGYCYLHIVGGSIHIHLTNNVERWDKTYFEHMAHLLVLAHRRMNIKSGLGTTEIRLVAKCTQRRTMSALCQAAVGLMGSDI